MKITLPHEREFPALLEIGEDCLREKLDIVIICEPYSFCRDIIQHFHRALLDIKDNRVGHIQIYREGIHFPNGSRVSIVQRTNNILRGRTPDQIYIMGTDAEFWYLLLSTGAEIKAIA